MGDYILKKDLPFAKAGAETFSRITHSFSPANSREEITFYRIEVENQFDGTSIVEVLIEEFDEWFEEKKPREFFIYKGEGKKYVSLCENLNNILLKSPDNTHWDEIIKVREVVE